MQLDYSARTIRQSNNRDSFELAPTATAVSLAKVRSDFNTGPAGNEFDFTDVTNDLELHGYSYRELERCQLTPQFSGGALPYVSWHFISHRPLQLLVMRRDGDGYASH